MSAATDELFETMVEKMAEYLMNSSLFAFALAEIMSRDKKLLASIVSRVDTTKLGNELAKEIVHQAHSGKNNHAAGVYGNIITEAKKSAITTLADRIEEDVRNA